MVPAGQRMLTTAAQLTTAARATTVAAPSTAQPRSQNEVNVTSARDATVTEIRHDVEMRSHQEARWRHG
jgi:hypothetical protein